MLTVAGLVFQLLSVICFSVVLSDAFKCGLGTGVAVLLLVPYSVYFGFTRFEHRHRALVLSGWLGAFALAVVFRVAGATHSS
jgi:hypothetical protein